MHSATSKQQQLKSFLLDNYGLEAVDVCRLGGYDNVNHQITADGTRYVLKSYESEQGLAERLDAENTVLKHLAGLYENAFPTPVPDKNGHYVTEGPHGGPARLLTFVEGEFFDDCSPSTEKRQSLGRFLATMDKRMLDLRLLAFETRVHDWDLRHLSLNRKYLEFIPKSHDRSIVEYFLQQHAEIVEPAKGLLRTGLIHSDAHGSNVLIRNGVVKGIIDFSDLTCSHLINEVAVAVTYVMFEEDDPLARAGEVLRGYSDVLPLEEKEVELLYYLIAGRLCISVCHSAEAKTRRPGDPHIVSSEEGAWKLLRKWVGISPLEAEDVFRASTGFESRIRNTAVVDLEKRLKHTSKALSISFDKPIKMASAAFQYMFDTLGNSYLDCYNNIPQVGHCHPRVVAAGQKAMARLNTNTRYLSDAYNDYAANLLEKFPANLNKVFFVNSGSAASDLAIRLAAAHTGNEAVMVMEHGYHGNTRLGIDISHYKYNRKGGAGRPENVVEAPIPDVYKGRHAGHYAGEFYAAEAVALIENIDLAAFIAEPVIGCGGQVPLPEGYLERVYPAVRERGGLCISDEVQTGFGRLGKYFWGFEMHNVQPDIVILGKPMGNGHPLAAVVTTDAIAESFETGMEFFSSFGGNTVSCAIGQAVLDVLEEENLPKNAENVGGHLLKRLKTIVENYENAGDARGEGLFLGLELVTDKESKKPATELASRVKEELKAMGILVGTDGPDVNVIKIKPPICFTKENADCLADAIEEILRKL